MAQGETLEQMYARINASAFIPPNEPTAVVGGKKRRRSPMAKPFKLKKGQEFSVQAPAGGGETKYPWDEWFNPDPAKNPSGYVLLERSSGTENDKGTITDVTEKRDYEVPRDAMPAKIKTAARRRYKVVAIYKRDPDGQPLENEGMVIKARDMTADERVEEDILRAEEKAKLKARKTGGSANGQANAPATQDTATAS